MCTSLIYAPLCDGAIKCKQLIWRYLKIFEWWLQRRHVVIAKVNIAFIISPYSQSYWVAALKVSLLQWHSTIFWWDVGLLDVHAQFFFWNLRFSPQPQTAVEGSCRDIAFIRMKLPKKNTWLSTQGQMPLQALRSFPKRSEVKLHAQFVWGFPWLFTYLHTLEFQHFQEASEIPAAGAWVFLSFKSSWRFIWQLAKDAYQLLLKQLAKKLAESGPPLDRLPHFTAAFQARTVR